MRILCSSLIILCAIVKVGQGCHGKPLLISPEYKRFTNQNAGNESPFGELFYHLNYGSDTYNCVASVVGYSYIKWGVADGDKDDIINAILDSTLCELSIETCAEVVGCIEYNYPD